MATQQVFSPFDGHLISEVPLSSEQDVKKMLDTAQQTFQSRSEWLTVDKRKEILRNMATLMQQHREELIKISAEEGGKPWMDTAVEADRAIQGVHVAIEHISQMTGTQIPMQQNASSMNRLAYTLREPVGVVLAISAFNHPINLIIHQVIPAIAVGCPVLIKPATNTPMSCFKLVELLYEAGLPKKWCQVFLTSNEITEKTLTDPRISFLSFIGSGRVGWYLRSKLPPGAHCALEHGGAAPVIVEADADIEAAIPLLVKGGFYHAGQVCVSVQRVYVQESICQSVAEKIAEHAKKLIVGDPLDKNTEVGPLITPKEVDRVAEWVQEATDKGGTVLCGGNKISNTCYQPTVILNPPEDAMVSQHEIFGPVVCVYSYKTRDEAIDRANALNFSFQSAIFTRDIDAAMDAINRLEAKAVMVNDHTAFRVDWMPFGGRKESGLAVGGIPYSMHDMTHEKLFVIKSGNL